jgi:hypothetical protein
MESSNIELLDDKIINSSTRLTNLIINRKIYKRVEYLKDSKVLDIQWFQDNEFVSDFDEIQLEKIFKENGEYRDTKNR